MSKFDVIVISGCPDSFSKLANHVLASGGLSQTDVSTVANCMERCAQDALCIGFDFNTLSSPNQCELILLEANMLGSIQDENGVNHFRRTGCEYASVSVSGK